MGPLHVRTRQDSLELYRTEATFSPEYRPGFVSTQLPAASAAGDIHVWMRVPPQAFVISPAEGI